MFQIQPLDLGLFVFSSSRIWFGALVGVGCLGQGFDHRQEVGSFFGTSCSSPKSPSPPWSSDCRRRWRTMASIKRSLSLSLGQGYPASLRCVSHHCLVLSWWEVGCNSLQKTRRHNRTKCWIGNFRSQWTSRLSSTRLVDWGNPPPWQTRGRRGEMEEEGKIFATCLNVADIQCTVSGFSLQGGSPLYRLFPPKDLGNSIKTRAKMWR